MAAAAIENFARLSADEQAAAIRRMARDGYGDYALAAATRLSVEQIRAALGAPKTVPETEAER